MAFGKAIAGETFNLMPNFGNEFGFVSFFGRGVKEFFFDFLEFFTTSEFAAHASSKDIAFAESEASEVVGDFDDIFLVDHDAIGFGHEVPQNVVGVFAFFGLNMTFDEGAHHSAPGYARADDATSGNQREVIVAFELPQ